MLHSRFRLNDKGEVALATAINSKRQMKITALMVVTIAVAVIALFALSGCGGSSAGSSSSGSSPSNAPEPAPVKTVDDYTWEELSEISAEISNEATEEGAIEVAKKYNLVNSDGTLDGTQTKTIELTDGTTAVVQIAGFLHDDKTDGRKAGITFIFKDAIAERSMNSSVFDSGGWEDSSLRSWLASDGLAMLPQDLTNVIVAVDKKTNNVGETDSASSVTATSDKLWLFSTTELCGFIDWFEYNDFNAVLNAEGSEYKLFRDCNVNANNSTNSILTKKYDGSSSAWWERSPEPESMGFYVISSTGWPDDGKPGDISYGVVPGFCI